MHPVTLGDDAELDRLGSQCSNCIHQSHFLNVRIHELTEALQTCMTDYKSKASITY